MFKEIRDFEDYLIFDDGSVFTTKRNIFLKGSRGIKLEDIIKEKVPLL